MDQASQVMQAKLPHKQLVAQKIARMTAPVTIGVIEPQFQKFSRMTAPVTTGVLKPQFLKKMDQASQVVQAKIPRKQLVAQKIARMTAPVNRSVPYYKKKVATIIQAVKKMRKNKQIAKKMVIKTENKRINRIS